ncbi:MAG: YCF48-related protein, partial [Candidatus Latescibacterota bacterium]
SYPRTRNKPAMRCGCPAIVALAAILLLTTTVPGSAQTWQGRTSNTVRNLVAVVYSTAATAAAVGANAATIASGDGGATWVDETVGTLAGAPDLRAVFSNGATIVAVGNDQAGPESIIASGDRGATWVEITSALINENLSAGLFVNSTNVVAVSDEGGGEVLLSVDRGASWTLISPRASQELNAIDSRSALVIAVGDAGSSEAIFRSVNSGVAWSEATSVSRVGNNFNDVTIASATNAVAVGQNGSIVLSTDSGDRWHLSADAANNLNAVDSNAGHVVAVGDGGVISRNTNNGAKGSWSVVASGTVRNLNDVLFLTGAIVLAVGDAGTIIGSTDRGATWSTQTSNTAQNLEAIAYNGVNNTLVVGANGTVLLSLSQISVPTPIPFRSKWPLVLLLVAAGLVALRRLRTAR